MNNVITAGRRLIAVEQIAFIETFDGSTSPGLESQRPFKARIKLLNRDSCLTETPFEALVSDHKFVLFSEDGVAINPAVDYSVETFEPTDDFTPAKDFKTRLLWKDPRETNAASFLWRRRRASLPP